MRRVTGNSALLLIPYNPLEHRGGLQSRALRTAKALSEDGWDVAIAAPGQNGRSWDVEILGFRNFREMARLILGRRWRFIHWLEVFPDPRVTVAQHVLSMLARVLGCRTVLGTGTPGNLIARGAPTLLRRLARHAYDGAVVFGPAFDLEYEQCGFSKERIFYLRQHVDCRYFRPCPPVVRQQIRRSLGIAASHFAVAYVGRLVARKRVDVLIDAFRHIAQSSVDLCLMVIGESQEHEDSVDQAILDSLRDLKAEDFSVFHAGFIEDPRRYYWAADVIVVPSDRDGEAAVAVEATACGTLAIVSDTPGLAGLFRDEAPDLRFASGSEQRLAEVLERLHTLSAAEYACIVRSRRSQVLAQHDTDNLGERLSNIYGMLNNSE